MSYEENKAFNRAPREMHKATCADCGQETEVPFKPDGSRPVYCRECFRNHRPVRRNNRENNRREDRY